MEKYFSWARNMDLQFANLFLNPFYITAVIGVSLASITGSVVSHLVRFTKTQFLAIESLHMILAAAATGYLMNLFINYLYPDITAYIIMILFMIMVSYMISRGYEENMSIATVAFLSAAIASLASYGLAIYSPVGPSIIYNILFGSPFFLRTIDLLISIYMTIIVLGAVLILWKKILLLSFDPEYFEFLNGSRKTSLYRIIVYILIAVSGIYLTRIVGAVAAHILMIAPSMTPFIKKISVSKSTIVILLISLSSVTLSVIANLPFGGVLGIFALIFYVAPSMIRSVGRH